jgi:hypothetical protein
MKKKRAEIEIKFLPADESNQLLHSYLKNSRKGITRSVLEAIAAHHSYFALVESGCTDQDKLRGAAQESISSLIGQISRIVADSVSRNHFNSDNLGDLAYDAWAALKGHRFVGAPPKTNDQANIEQ